MKLGDIVHVRGHAKGDDAAFVVVSEPRDGVVRLSYCGSGRWYKARTFRVEQVVIAGEGAKAKRARRMVAAEQPEADGWIRIQTGRRGQPGRVETIGHISQRSA